MKRADPLVGGSQDRYRSRVVGDFDAAPARGRCRGSGYYNVASGGVYVWEVCKYYILRPICTNDIKWSP